jgi:hypothetical protein
MFCRLTAMDDRGEVLCRWAGAAIADDDIAIVEGVGIGHRQHKVHFSLTHDLNGSPEFSQNSKVAKGHPSWPDVR